MRQSLRRVRASKAMAVRWNRGDEPAVRRGLYRSQRPPSIRTVVPVT